MQKIKRFKFPCPENKPRKKIWPVFLPYQGCPNRCIYCAQIAQTGTSLHSLHDYYQALKTDLERASAQNYTPMELAFYGGTFTALPDKWAYRFLELTAKFKEKGLISKIRCSTRPDVLTRELLQDFQLMGLDMVELGIQSFSDEVLEHSRRGYTSKIAENSCQMVKQAKMDLGIQLLPGLPKQDRERWFHDVTCTINQQPSVVRIYPCLTIKKTKLAQMWEQNKYTPWSLAETVNLLSRGVLSLCRNNIQVSRMGLPPERDLLNQIIDGPWHPALGSIVQSRILYYLLLTQKSIMGPSNNFTLFSPKKYQGIMWGYKGSNKQALNSIGIHPQNVVFWNKDYFQLQSFN